MRDYTQLTTEELHIEKQKLQDQQRFHQTCGKNYFPDYSHIIKRGYDLEYAKIDRELQKRTK